MSCADLFREPPGAQTRVRTFVGVRRWVQAAVILAAAWVPVPAGAQERKPLKVAVVEVRDRYTGATGLGEFLRSEGLEVRDVTDGVRNGQLPDPADTGLLLVGSFATNDAAVRAGLVGAAEKLRSFVRSGGVVAILCQADQDREAEEWLEPPARLVRSDADADAAHFEQENHPLLRGPAAVTAADLRGWRVPANWGSPNTLWETFTHWSEAGVILASGPPGQPRTAGLVEMAWGRGRVVTYAMAPDKAVAAGNEAARRGGAALLRNLVAYAAQVREGSAAPVELTPPPRYAHPLEGTVFLDRNGNGRFDSGDTPLEGVPVSDGGEVTLTDASGAYRLENAQAAAVLVYVHQTPAMALNGQEFFHRLPAGDAPPRKFDFALRPAESSVGADGIRFVQLTDSHVRSPSDRAYMMEATDEIYAMDPAPDFVVATGDLVDAGIDEQYRNYVAGMQKPPVPYFNVFGNHEVSRGPLSRYHEYIGPDYYSWESGGIVFLALNCVIQSKRQDAWLTRILEVTAKDRPVVVFQHYPPNPDQLGKFGKLGVRSVFSGHWHSEKEIHHAGVQSVNSPTFIMGGIDASPAGFKVVHLKPDGSAETGWRYGFQKQRLTIVSPQEGEPASGRELPILVNAYDTSHEVSEVRWQLGTGTGPAAGGSLSRESATAWTGVHRGAGEAPASLPIRVEATDARGRTWAVTRQVEFGAGPPAAPAPHGEWRQFMGDAAHTGFTPQCPALPLRLAWSVDTGGDPDFASPMLAGGRLFLALKKRTAGRTNGVASFDPVTGRRLWIRETQTAVNHTPAIAGDTLCVAEMGGRIHGLDAATGQPRWHHDLIEPAGRFSYCAPALADGSLFAGVLRRMAKLDPATGRVHWERRIGTSDTDWISSYGSPAVHGDVLVMTGQFGRGESLVAVRASDGEKLWGHPADGGMLASATIAGDRVLFCTQKSVLRCHRLTDGESIWEQPLGDDMTDGCWSATTPAVSGGTGPRIVVAGSGDGRMCGIDLESGRVLWTHTSKVTTFKVSPYRRDGRPLVSSPVIAGESVFFGSADGHVYCLSVRTGQELWAYVIGVPVLSTPLVTGNAVYAAAFDGRLYAWTTASH